MFVITNKISDFTAKNFVKDMSRDALMSLSYRLMHKNMSTCIKDATNVTLNHLNRILANGVIEGTRMDSSEDPEMY